MFGRKIIAELAEIDENLIRSPLTPAKEASATRKSRRTWGRTITRLVLNLPPSDGVDFKRIDQDSGDGWVF
jgi:hypothetical protein